MAAPNAEWWYLVCPDCEHGTSWYGRATDPRPQHRCATDHQVKPFPKATTMRAPARMGDPPSARSNRSVR